MLDKKQANSFYFLAYVLLSILILNSIYLSYKYVNFYYLGDMVSSFDCMDDCDSVMMSSYSLLFGVPVPIYGLVYFLALTFFFVILTSYKSEKDNLLTKLSNVIIDSDKFQLQQKLFEFMLLTGCLVAIWFLYILYGELKMFCKFCMLSHTGLFLFTFVYFFLLRGFSFKLK
jgi:uncharacterized membrane protein